MGVAVRGQHFEDAVPELEDAHVVRSATEVEHHDLLVGRLLVEAVGEGGSRGLVDDALHLQTGDFPGLLGGLALAVVEVGRNRHDGTGDLRSEIVLGSLLHLLENHGADLLRAEVPVVDLDPGRAAVGFHHVIGDASGFAADLLEHLAHESLHGVDRLGGVGDGLTLGGIAHLALSILDEGDDGRGRPLAFTVVDDHRLVAFHHGDARVRGAEVNADDFAHVCRIDVCVVDVLGRRAQDKLDANAKCGVAA